MPVPSGSLKPMGGNLCDAHSFEQSQSFRWQPVMRLAQSDSCPPCWLSVRRMTQKCGWPQSEYATDYG
eukprot:5449329-Amphidinium_carterae.2